MVKGEDHAKFGALSQQQATCQSLKPLDDIEDGPRAHFKTKQSLILARNPTQTKAKERSVYVVNGEAT